MFPLTLLSGVAVTAMQWRRRRSAPFWFSVTGVILFIATLIITLAIEVPINNQIKTWVVATLPPIGKRFKTAGSGTTQSVRFCPLLSRSTRGWQFAQQ
jgi:hypothetical protein